MNSKFTNTLFTALMALVFGFLGAAAWSYAGLADNRTRGYLVENPEILEEMFTELQTREAQGRLAEVAGEIYTPFPGAVMGNPQGSRVLVEFTDYNCGYCEAATPDVARLIAEDPELKVVLREMPQFDGSEDAARWALAAAIQGKYSEFHQRMFRMGPANAATAEQVARDIGLDVERARADAASEQVTAELVRNFTMARVLGFNGTPGWVAGDTPVNGYIGYERMKAVLNEAGPALGG